jgi:hypothetical protein
MNFGEYRTTTKLSIFLTMLFILLQGCATTGPTATGPLFEPENPPIETQSLLYIYRPDIDMLGPRTATIYINEEKLIELPNGGYMSVRLSPGTYRVKQIWNPWPGDFEYLSEEKNINLTLEAGKTHFLELKVVQQGYHASWSLWVVPPSAGQARISSCKRLEARPEEI